MNSILESCSSIEELDEKFSKKIALVRTCVELRNMDEAGANAFKSLYMELRGLQVKFKELRDLLKSGREKVVEFQNLVERLEKLKRRLDHMEENFPAVFKVSAPVVQKEKKGPTKVACVKNEPIVPKNNRTIAKMQFLTIQEFENVPKYMKGRFRYDQVNQFVEEFNKALESKYKIRLMSQKELKPPQLKEWQKMKAQENAETKGLFFCTSNDLKDYGNVKLDKASLNVLTILRHCGKVREIRGPGPIIRYAVV